MNDLREKITKLPQEKIKNFHEEVMNLMNDRFWCLKNGFKYESVNYAEACSTYYKILARGDNF